MTVALIQANSLALPLMDESVDCVVTSPPYWGLRDDRTDGQLGLELTLHHYIENLVNVFSEVWSVLTPTGTLWLNMGDAYAGSRIPGLKTKDLIGLPWRTALALQSWGWYLRRDIIWSKPNAMPESARDRPTVAHEYVFLLSKRSRYYYDRQAVQEPRVTKPREKRKPSGWDKGRGRHDRLIGRYPSKQHRPSDHEENHRNKRSVWTINTQAFPGNHFATFPEELVSTCILAGCPPGGLVLDPFVGSGTTLKVAQELQRSAVGIDLSMEYLQLARRRTSQGVLK